MNFRTKKFSLARNISIIWFYSKVFRRLYHIQKDLNKYTNFRIEKFLLRSENSSHAFNSRKNQFLMQFWNLVSPLYLFSEQFWNILSWLLRLTTYLNVYIVRTG